MVNKKNYEVLPFALKQRVIEEIDKGIITRSQAMEKYGIRSENTFSNWRKQIARGHARTYRHFPAEQKIQIVNEVMSGLKSAKDVKEELDLYSVRTVESWIEKYRNSMEEIQTTDSMEIQSASDTSEELHLARLKILSLEALITEAEKRLNFPIRKKFGTKQ